MNRLLDTFRYYVEHAINANEDGDDFAIPRAYIDALTTMGILEKVGRGKWTVTKDASEVASQLAILSDEV